MGDRRGELSGVRIADAWSPRFAGFFGWYAQRSLRRCFHAVRIARGSRQVLGDIGPCASPALVAMSHASWWDPMLAVAMWRWFFPGRGNVSPMDATQLAKFRVLRKLGIFGIDPDDPASLDAMGAYLRRRLGEMARPTVILTPQGRFVDVREPAVPRPGAAALLASLPGMRAWSVAVEYAFWVDAKPEIFVRAVEVPTPDEPRTASWQRALQQAMEENRRALAELVRARDPGAFECVVGGEFSTVHPVYDAWRAMLGRSGGIDTSHRSGS